MLIHRRRGATTHAPRNPRAPFWVAAAWAHLDARRSSAMKEHRLRRVSADLGPRRSQRARSDFCHGLLALDSLVHTAQRSTRAVRSVMVLR